MEKKSWSEHMKNENYFIDSRGRKEYLTYNERTEK